MIDGVCGARSAPNAAASGDAKLHQTALQMEGLFVQKLFAAMRETVPTDGVMAPSSAEGTFTQLLDEKVAQAVPEEWTGHHSIARALHEQLKARMSGEAK